MTQWTIRLSSQEQGSGKQETTAWRSWEKGHWKRWCEKFREKPTDRNADDVRSATVAFWLAIIYIILMQQKEEEIKRLSLLINYLEIVH